MVFADILRRGGIAIVDEKSGAYDCFKLDDDDKGDNAQNYAWLAGVSPPNRVLNCIHVFDLPTWIHAVEKQDVMVQYS